MTVPYERPAWLEIDLSAIRKNVATLKAMTASGTQFMAVVKADAYGHGAVVVAREALAAGANRLGVATVEEALELRDSGITAPLQLLSEPPASAASLLVEHNVTPAVYGMPFAEALSAAASGADGTASCHVKVDTGMSRIGVRPEDAVEFVERVSNLAGVRLEGVFTHFATADVPGDWEFDRQLERFRDLLLRLKSRGIDPGIVHAANSAATILHPESHFGMVRCGIAMYGLHPAPTTHAKVDLIPAMSAKARISHVKSVSMGEGVSYGFTWHAPEGSTLATLPLGYADGVPRTASNLMEVLISGRRCGQVGRVCMDQVVVEVPRGVSARPGDEAVIVGAQGDERITMDELAEHAQTINYELACSFSRRLGRRYLSAHA